jgi:hypothetical protein
MNNEMDKRKEVQEPDEPNTPLYNTPCKDMVWPAKLQGKAFTLDDIRADTEKKKKENEEAELP